MITKPHIRFAIAVIAFCLLSGVSGFSRAQATETQTLNIGWLLESARNVILTSDPWAVEGCSVEVNGTPSDITIYHSGRIDVEAYLERVPNSLRDIGAVGVDVYAGGELYMRFDPSPYLLVTVPVYTTATDLDRGQIINSINVSEVPTDVRNLPSGDLYQNIEDIVGMAARVNLQAGRILTDGMLEPPTMVVRGETVIVFIELTSARISLHGTALDSGAVGDEIRVRNPDSSMIITATVTGPSQARIFLL